MPGIVGVISPREAHRCERLVSSMVESMGHEPFYAAGTYAVPELGVYSGWTSFDASLASAQFVVNEAKDAALILAGECPGNSARQLLDLYENEGDHFFEELNGLFSGLLIDKKRKKAVLFNDRYGSERIYYYETAAAFYFASEAKALLRINPELREFDRDGIAQFCAFGCTFNWRTLFRGVQLVPGGSAYTFAEGVCHKRQYFHARQWENLSVLSAESFEEQFEEALKRILPRHFESESKIGVSLTGGLDTRMIVACRSERGETPISYIFTGQTGKTMDDRIADRVARMCHLPHRLLRLNSDFFSDFGSHADRTVYITDGCFGITGAHEIYLNKSARQLAPVRITGLFGSEILRGVSTFKPIGLSPSLFHPDFEQSVGAARRQLTDQVNPVTTAAFRNVPWNLFGSLAAARSQVIVRTPYLDNEIVALAYQAPESLRTSAQTALRVIGNNKRELLNIPTDRRIESKNGRLTGRLQRLVFEGSFKLDYLYNEGMPSWLCPFDPLLERLNARVRIFGHHKFLHYRSWFRRELAPYIQEVLADRAVKQAPFWNTASLSHMTDAHIGGRRNYSREINTVLTLEAIERLLFRELPRTSELLSPAAVAR